MSKTRIERDLLGTLEIPAGSLTGVHTARAIATFGVAGRPVDLGLVRAYGAVKLAAISVNRELGYLEDPLGVALEEAARELMAGDLAGHVVVDALQGGAGTATNMNVNEVIGNRALVLIGREPGDPPLEAVNLHQSTNDTFPTALRVAVIWALQTLEGSLVELVAAFQDKERDLHSVVKIGRTQLQDAVPITLGREMAAYAQALARDRWRIYKCQERLRVVNLGGTAIGTGVLAPRGYIFRVVDRLKEITGLPLARAEDLVEATQNQDVLVEVSGMMSALGSTLLKIARDLRLMASGPVGGLGELGLPPRMAGSSIMPGKVNPVVPEAVCQAAMVAMADHQAVSMACSLGDLELNPFLPLVADRLLEQVHVLTEACRSLARDCVAGMSADQDRCRRGIETSTAAVTALAEELGYHRAQEVGQESQRLGIPLVEAAERAGISRARFAELTSPERVLRLGSRELPGVAPGRSGERQGGAP